MPSFQFLYVTDLHGWQFGYERTLELAIEKGIRWIVNGGDILPKGKTLESSLSDTSGPGGRPAIFQVQENFIRQFLPDYFARCRQAGIDYLCMFGNDDVGCQWETWCAEVEKFPRLHELSAGWIELPDDLIIRGCPYVPDVPFRLKDWVMRDDEGVKSPPPLSPPVVSTHFELELIHDIDAFLDTRPTLAAHLDSIAGEAPGRDMRRAIFVGHSPPADTGLAIITDGTDVGSAATTRWIEREQPLLTLHGHIHESPEVSGIHTMNLGRTVCHNPGQSAPDALAVSVVTIDGDRVEIERLRLAAE